MDGCEHYERIVEILDIAHQARLSLNAHSEESVGLSLEQILVLDHIERGGGALTVSQLAGALSRTSHNVTYLAGRLAKQGLVTRRHSRFGDRRIVLVRITEDGSAKVRDFRASTSARFALEDDDVARRLDQVIAVLKELAPNGWAP